MESRAVTPSTENVSEKSPGRLSRWNSSASLSGAGKKMMKEEKGGDGIGRLDA